MQPLILDYCANPSIPTYQIIILIHHLLLDTTNHLSKYTKELPNIWNPKHRNSNRHKLISTMTNSMT